MNLIVIGDNHNDIENMLVFLEKLKKFSFEAILYTGDFTDVTTPKGFSQEEIALLIIEELKTLKKPVFAVPGNNDTVKVIDIIKKEGISIHGKGVMLKDVGFYGYGGAKTPFNTTIEPTEEELKTNLEKGWNDIKDVTKKIQLTHMPPLNTRLDMVSTGTHVGSKTIREFIETKRPLASVSAHIHEARGVDRIGNTLLLNPGRISEGYFGLITIKDGLAEGNVFNLTEKQG
ncbi:MAG: metallophosphoesterase family protein [Candidatus Aenigmarchaeota archaeon]|nr:metallophosphoesterase family protein [Candidatus Aenigmarchaeota archaeon]